MKIEKPSWFSLSYYSGTSKWSASDWLEALTARRILVGFVGGIPGVPCDIQAETGLLSGEEVCMHLDRIRENPISPIDFAYGDTGEVTLSSGGAVVASRPIRNAGSRNGLQPKHRLTWVDVSVDLAAPDKDLVDSFKAWLSEQRGKRKKLMQVSRTTLRNWSDSLVLPYIDLKIYFTAIGVPQTNSAVAELLFADSPHKDEEALRKVTQQHAKNVLTRSLHRRLSAQLSLGMKQTPDKMGRANPDP